MASIQINTDTVENETLPLLRKELGILKAEKEYIENTSVLKADSDIVSIYRSICNRYEEVQKQIRWLLLICKEYKRNITEGCEAINDIIIPSIETPGFVVK